MPFDSRQRWRFEWFVRKCYEHQTEHQSQLAIYDNKHATLNELGNRAIERFTTCVCVHIVHHLKHSFCSDRFTSGRETRGKQNVYHKIKTHLVLPHFFAQSFSEHIFFFGDAWTTKLSIQMVNNSRQTNNAAEYIDPHNLFSQIESNATSLKSCS